MSERRPWILITVNGDWKDVLGDTGEIVVRCWDEKIAAQVVREHNAHDDLVEACESLLHRFGHLDTDAGKREAVKEAEAAIAKAKEVQPV